MNMNKHALFNALKEPLRLLVLAVIPFIIVYFGEFNAQWAIMAVVVLRFLDKWVHLAAADKPVTKRREGILGVKGLTGF